MLETDEGENFESDEETSEVYDLKDLYTLIGSKKDNRSFIRDWCF